MGATREKARSEHHVRSIREKWLENGGVFGRVVLQVGVLNDDEVARGVLEARAQGGTLSLIHLMENDPHSWVGDSGQDLTRAIP